MLNKSSLRLMIAALVSLLHFAVYASPVLQKRQKSDMSWKTYPFNLDDYPDMQFPAAEGLHPSDQGDSW